jgi:hypothetical protein
MAQRKPILQLKADCDPTKFIQVKLTQTYAGGRTVKRDTPTMDGASIQAVLQCIREFDELASDLNFDTGNKLFSNFCRILRGAAKDEWDTISNPIQNCTRATFNTALETLKAEMILPTARQT